MFRREVYERFGIAMPLMYQRATATLADSSTLRFLARYDLPLLSLQAQDEKALNDLLEAQLPPTVEQALGGVSAMIDERMEALARAVLQIDPTLEGTVKTTLGKMQHELQTLHTEVRRVFLDAQERQVTVELEEQLLETQRRNHEAATRLFALARRERLDVLEAELEVTSQEEVVRQSRASVDNALLEVCIHSAH